MTQLLATLLTRGVQFFVRSSDAPDEDLLIGPDGLIGQFRPGSRLLLVVRMVGERFAALHRHQNGGNGDGEESQHSWHAPAAECDGRFWELDRGDGKARTREVSLVVPVEGEGRKGFTRWPNNQLHLIVPVPASEAKGDQVPFDLVQVSLASQEKRVYLRVQTLYTGTMDYWSCQVDDAKFAAHWGGLESALERYYRQERNFSVPAPAGVQSDEDYDRWVPNSADRNLTGRVRFWNDSMGTGALEVVLGSGEVVVAKVHYSAILAPEGTFRTLSDGAHVRVGLLAAAQHSHGPKAGRYRLEAKGVQVEQ